jgi:hypothetical protein
VTYEILAAAIVYVFTALLVMGSLTTGARALELKRRGLSLPTLLTRDLICWTGLAWPFVLIGLVRAWDLGATVAGRIDWLLITGVPPLIAAATYVWFELRVIGKRT